MAAMFLCNNVTIGQRRYLAPLKLDSATDAGLIATLEANGGRVFASTPALISAASAAGNVGPPRTKDGAPAGNQDIDDATGIMLAAAIEDAATEVPAGRTLTAISPITGGGDLSADRSFGFDKDAVPVTTLSGHQFFGAPAAADLVSIVAAVDLTNGGPTTLTIAAQPDYPRKLQVRIVDADNSASGTLTLTFKDAQGDTQIQAIAITGGTRTITTTLACGAFVSAVTTGVAGAAAGDTVGIGVADALAPTRIRGNATPTFAVFAANVNGVREAVGTVDATAGTIVPTTLPNGANNYDIWHTYKAVV